MNKALISQNQIGMSSLTPDYGSEDTSHYYFRRSAVEAANAPIFVDASKHIPNPERLVFDIKGWR